MDAQVNWEESLSSRINKFTLEEFVHKRTRQMKMIYSKISQFDWFNDERGTPIMPTECQFLQLPYWKGYTSGQSNELSCFNRWGRVLYDGDEGLKAILYWEWYWPIYTKLSDKLSFHLGPDWKGIRTSDGVFLCMNQAGSGSYGTKRSEPISMTLSEAFRHTCPSRSKFPEKFNNDCMTVDRPVSSGCKRQDNADCENT